MKIVDSADNPHNTPSLYEGYVRDHGTDPVFLTTVGREIFANHLRMDRATRLAGILGALTQSRAQQPLIEPVVVATFYTPDLSEDDRYIAHHGVLRTVDYLGSDTVEDAFLTLPRHTVISEERGVETVREVPMPVGTGYLRTHLGNQFCQVVLSPEPLFGVTNAPDAQDHALQDPHHLELDTTS